MHSTSISCAFEDFGLAYENGNLEIPWQAAPFSKEENLSLEFSRKDVT